EPGFSAAQGRKLESGDGIVPVRPALRAPGLHDKLTRPQIEVDAGDVIVIATERATDAIGDPGSFTGEARMAARNHEGGIDFLGRCRDADRLPDGSRLHATSSLSSVRSLQYAIDFAALLGPHKGRGIEVHVKKSDPVLLDFEPGCD